MTSPRALKNTLCPDRFETRRVVICGALFCGGFHIYKLCYDFEMSNYIKELDVAERIAKESGVIILKYFDGDQQVELKADKSQVTIADKEVNSLVIKRLLEAFPEDGVIGEEESTASFGMGRKWFCDPIDGTAGYVWGTPTAMFSLALVVDGKPVMGVAYDPFLNKMYTGMVGEKSLCNGKLISVSTVDLKSGIFAVSGSVKSLPKQKYFQRMIDDKIRLATFSGAVYKCCLIAKGKFVGYIEDCLSPHDVAAVQCILEGAGGKLTALDGSELDYSKPFKGAIASNGVVHDEVLKYLDNK
jgi:fructose-1,6-bisphosphatase/inositol monophosphatase family enzyme